MHYGTLNRLANITNNNPDNSALSSNEYELNYADIRRAVAKHDDSRIDYDYNRIKL